jgi:hypothetical protein
MPRPSELIIAEAVLFARIRSVPRHIRSEESDIPMAVATTGYCEVRVHDLTVGGTVEVRLMSKV